MHMMQDTITFTGKRVAFTKVFGKDLLCRMRAKVGIFIPPVVMQAWNDTCVVKSLLQLRNFRGVCNSR